jgi:hypothetical protein
VKNEKRAKRDQRKAQPVIPAERLLQIQDRKAGEHHQCDDFLRGLELRRAVDGTAPAIGRHRQPIFEERNAQLTMIASGSQTSLNFRWPYQAKVMKTLEANSIRTGKTEDEMAGMDILSKNPMPNGKARKPVPYALRQERRKP